MQNSQGSQASSVNAAASIPPQQQHYAAQYPPQALHRSLSNASAGGGGSHSNNNRYANAAAIQYSQQQGPRRSASYASVGSGIGGRNGSGMLLSSPHQQQQRGNQVFGAGAVDDYFYAHHSTPRSSMSQMQMQGAVAMSRSGSSRHNPIPIVEVTELSSSSSSSSDDDDDDDGEWSSSASDDETTDSTNINEAPTEEPQMSLGGEQSQQTPQLAAMAATKMGSEAKAKAEVRATLEVGATEEDTPSAFTSPSLTAGGSSASLLQQQQTQAAVSQLQYEPTQHFGGDSGALSAPPIPISPSSSAQAQNRQQPTSSSSTVTAVLYPHPNVVIAAAIAAAAATTPPTVVPPPAAGEQKEVEGEVAVKRGRGRPRKDANTNTNNAEASSPTTATTTAAGALSPPTSTPTAAAPQKHSGGNKPPSATVAAATATARAVVLPPAASAIGSASTVNATDDGKKSNTSNSGGAPSSNSVTVVVHPDYFTREDIAANHFAREGKRRVAAVAVDSNRSRGGGVGVGEEGASAPSLLLDEHASVDDDDDTIAFQSVHNIYKKHWARAKAMCYAHRNAIFSGVPEGERFRHARLVNVQAWEHYSSHPYASDGRAVPLPSSSNTNTAAASLLSNSYCDRDVMLPSCLLTACGGSSDRTAKTLRQHQVNGIRFLWASLVDAPRCTRRRKPDEEGDHAAHYERLKEAHAKAKAAAHEQRQQQQKALLEGKQQQQGEGDDNANDANNNARGGGSDDDPHVRHLFPDHAPTPIDNNSLLPPLPPRPVQSRHVASYGCILAHSMGLGKTCQVTLFMNLFAKHAVHKPRIVICTPKSTISGWKAELAQWGKFIIENDTGPNIAMSTRRSETSNNDADGNAAMNGVYTGLRTFVIDDTVKNKQDKLALTYEWDRHGGVLLLGYEGLVHLQEELERDYARRALANTNALTAGGSASAVITEVFSEHNPIDLVVCDEAHRLKSGKLQAMRALQRTHPIRRLLLTGTPLQNHLEEYWTMITFAMPKFFEKRWFQQFFIKPIVKAMEPDATSHDIDLAKKKTFALIKEVEPFVQRVDSTPLKSELPPLFEYIVVIKLSPLQQQLYDQFIKLLVRMKLTRDGFNLLQANAYANKICGHPQLMFSSSVAIEALKAQQKATEKKNKKQKNGDANDNDDAAGYLSATSNSSEDSIDARMRKQQHQKAPPRGGGTAANGGSGGDTNNAATTTNSSRAEFVNTFGTFFTIPKQYTPKTVDSCKFSIAFDIIAKAIENEEKTLVFSFSTELLDLFQALMKKDMPHVKHFRIDGSTSGADRQQMIQRFEGSLNGAGNKQGTSSNQQTTLDQYTAQRQQRREEKKAAKKSRLAEEKEERRKKREAAKKKKKLVKKHTKRSRKYDDDDYLLFASEGENEEDEEEDGGDDDGSDYSLSDVDDEGNLIDSSDDEEDDEAEADAQQQQQPTARINPADASADVFMLSTKAGGVGLTLTAATRVIIMDTSFNPADDRQAVGRAYRYGQTHPVFVYRLVVEDSFEHRLLYQKVAKEWLFQTVVDTKMVKRDHLAGLKIRDALMTAIPVSKDEESRRRRGTAVCFRQDEGVLLQLAERVAYVAQHDGFFEEGDEKYGEQEVQWYEEYQKRMNKGAGQMLPTDEYGMLGTNSRFLFDGSNNALSNLLAHDPQLRPYGRALADPRQTVRDARANIGSDANSLGSMISSLIATRHAERQQQRDLYYNQRHDFSVFAGNNNNKNNPNNQNQQQTPPQQQTAHYPTSGAFLEAQRKLEEVRAVKLRQTQRSQRMESLGDRLGIGAKYNAVGSHFNNTSAAGSLFAGGRGGVITGGRVGAVPAHDAFGSAATATGGVSRNAAVVASHVADSMRSAFRTSAALLTRPSNTKRTSTAASNTKESAFSLEDDSGDLAAAQPSRAPLANPNAAPLRPRASGGWGSASNPAATAAVPRAAATAAAAPPRPPPQGNPPPPPPPRGDIVVDFLDDDDD